MKDAGHYISSELLPSYRTALSEKRARWASHFIEETRKQIKADNFTKSKNAYIKILREEYPIGQMAVALVQLEANAGSGKLSTEFCCNFTIGMLERYIVDFTDVLIRDIASQCVRLGLADVSHPQLVDCNISFVVGKHVLIDDAISFTV